MDPLIVKIAGIIKKVLYVNLATITPEGLPWNSPVFYVYDSNLNLYWFSWRQSQHSINIRHNSAVFCTIYDSSVKPGDGKGVYLQGDARELEKDEEIILPVQLVYKRLERDTREPKQFQHEFPRRIYKFTPMRIWTNVDNSIGGHYIDTRQELDLSELIKQINIDENQ